MHALRGKAVSQVTKQTNKKNSNNKQYKTALFQNETVPSHSEEGRDFLISYILRKTKRKN